MAQSAGKYTVHDILLWLLLIEVANRRRCAYFLKTETFSQTLFHRKRGCRCANEGRRKLEILKGHFHEGEKKYV